MALSLFRWHAKHRHGNSRRDCVSNVDCFKLSLEHFIFDQGTKPSTIIDIGEQVVNHLNTLAQEEMFLFDLKPSNSCSEASSSVTMRRKTKRKRTIFEEEDEEEDDGEDEEDEGEEDEEEDEEGDEEEENERGRWMRFGCPYIDFGKDFANGAKVRAWILPC